MTNATTDPTGAAGDGADDEDEPGAEDETLRDAAYHYVLSERQQIALAALLSGATHDAAAQAAGVHRTTLSAWTRRDVNFIAERNRCRAELTERVASALVSAAARAVEVAQAAIEAEAAEGKAVVSLGLLKLIEPRGLLADWPGGPQTPQGVEAEQNAQRQADILRTLSAFSGLGLPGDWDDEDEDEYENEDDDA